jgi:hypothetical protein
VAPFERWYVGGLANCTALTTGTVVSGILYAFPFIAPRGGTLDRLGIFLQTPIAASSGRIGIYDTTSTTNLVPNNLVVDGGILATTGTSGARTATISTVLSPDTIYWLVYTSSNSTVVLRSLAVGGCFSLLGLGLDLGTAPGVGWSASAMPAPLPATYPVANRGIITAVPIPAIACRLSG